MVKGLGREMLRCIIMFGLHMLDALGSRGLLDTDLLNHLEVCLCIEA